jgi:hypothetical protein
MDADWFFRGMFLWRDGLRLRLAQLEFEDQAELDRFRERTIEHQPSSWLAKILGDEFLPVLLVPETIPTPERIEELRNDLVVSTDHAIKLLRKRHKRPVEAIQALCRFRQALLGEEMLCRGYPFESFLIELMNLPEERQQTSAGRWLRARDTWIYRQAMKGATWSAILRGLKQMPKSWPLLSSINAVKRAATSYARRQRPPLPPPPMRKPGRPKASN